MRSWFSWLHWFSLRDVPFCVVFPSAWCFLTCGVFFCVVFPFACCFLLLVASFCLVLGVLHGVLADELIDWWTGDRLTDVRTWWRWFSCIFMYFHEFSLPVKWRHSLAWQCPPRILQRCPKWLYSKDFYFQPMGKCRNTLIDFFIQYFCCQTKFFLETSG